MRHSHHSHHPSPALMELQVPAWPTGLPAHTQQAIDLSSNFPSQTSNPQGRSGASCYTVSSRSLTSFRTRGTHGGLTTSYSSDHSRLRLSAILCCLILPFRLGIFTSPEVADRGVSSNVLFLFFSLNEKSFIARALPTHQAVYEG